MLASRVQRGIGQNGNCERHKFPWKTALEAAASRCECTSEFFITIQPTVRGGLGPELVELSRACCLPI